MIYPSKNWTYAKMYIDTEQYGRNPCRKTVPYHLYLLYVKIVNWTLVWHKVLWGVCTEHLRTPKDFESIFERRGLLWRKSIQVKSLRMRLPWVIVVWNRWKVLFFKCFLFTVWQSYPFILQLENLFISWDSVTKIFRMLG